MSVPARRLPVPARFPDVLDWLDAPWSALLPFRSGETFRVEDYKEDGDYVIRAELPGVDPEKDVEVSVHAGLLTIHAERRQETKAERHSEFRYGELTRSVALPGGADAGNITARYDNGILEVSVPVPEHATSGRRIRVERNS